MKNLRKRFLFTPVTQSQFFVLRSTVNCRIEADEQMPRRCGLGIAFRRC